MIGMLFLYHALLYFALCTTSAAAPAGVDRPLIAVGTNQTPGVPALVVDGSSKQRTSQPSHKLNPLAPSFYPKSGILDDGSSKQQTPRPSHKLNPHAPSFHAKSEILDGSNPPHNPYVLSYEKADINNMQSADALGLIPGRLYNVRKHMLGFKGAGDHNAVPVVYNGPVPGFQNKIAFVSLVQTGSRSPFPLFPSKYTEPAGPCFVATKSYITRGATIITKYAYMVWAQSLTRSPRFDGIELKSDKLREIQKYMEDDYKKRNLGSTLVTNRKDLGQKALSLVGV